MAPERRALDDQHPAALAAWARALVPGAGSVAGPVAAIVERVRGGGDDALLIQGNTILPSGGGACHSACTCARGCQSLYRSALSLCQPNHQ